MCEYAKYLMYALNMFSPFQQRSETLCSNCKLEQNAHTHKHTEVLLHLLSVR